MQTLAVSSEPSSSQTSTITSASPFDSYTTIIDEEAELHLWDREKEYFIKQTEGRATIVGQPNNSKTNGYEYWIVTRSTEEDDRGNVVLWHKIDSDMNQRWSTKVWSLTWNHMDQNGTQTSWCFRFLAQESYANFQEQFTRALWETLHQVPWSTSKVGLPHCSRTLQLTSSKPDEQAYALRSNEDVEMYDIEEDEVEEEAVLDELDGDKKARLLLPRSNTSFFQLKNQRKRKRGKRRKKTNYLKRLKMEIKTPSLLLGSKEIGRTSYAVTTLGCFDIPVIRTESNIMRQLGTSPVQRARNLIQRRCVDLRYQPCHFLTPHQQVMLHDSDNKMILFDDATPNSLFALDIERGKVVEEWKVDDYVPVSHIAPKDKYAQTTGEQTVVGISGNALYRIDPRLSGNKMVQNEMKQYTTKTKFSAVTTTSSGKLAVAGDKGDIRLFDSIGKNAKTALPALGDPILGIDVSSDGRWIVATTKTYLLLIDTMIGDGKHAGSLGFDRAFPADAKPIPRRLQLRGEHVAYMNHSISFTPARYVGRRKER